MKPARRRTWKVGDCFSLNRWRDGDPRPPLVFEITKRTARRIWFYARGYDTGQFSRKISTRVFYRQIARRELIRVWEGMNG